jgi:RNA polymerase sigma-70 factor (ECF subfamily)
MDDSHFIAQASQDKKLEFDDVIRGLSTLPPDQREALILVTVENMSYEQVAVICGCPIGTVKSRVNRARARLEAHLEGNQNSS